MDSSVDLREGEKIGGRKKSEQFVPTRTPVQSDLSRSLPLRNVENISNLDVLFGGFSG